MASNKRHSNRKLTQRKQAAANPKLHPRGLARSVAKHYGGGKIDLDWKERVARLPRIGRKYLHPEMHRYTRDCSGSIGCPV